MCTGRVRALRNPAVFNVSKVFEVFVDKVCHTATPPAKLTFLSTISQYYFLATRLIRIRQGELAGL